MCSRLPRGPSSGRRAWNWFPRRSGPAFTRGSTARDALWSLYTRGPAGGGLLSRSAATRAFRYCVCGRRQLPLPLVVLDKRHRSARDCVSRAFRLSRAFRGCVRAFGNRVPTGSQLFLVFVVVPGACRVSGGPAVSRGEPLCDTVHDRAPLIVSRGCRRRRRADGSARMPRGTDRSGGAVRTAPRGAARAARRRGVGLPRPIGVLTEPRLVPRK